MSELEAKEYLSSKTVDVLVEIIIELIRLVSSLSMEVQINEQICKEV